MRGIWRHPARIGAVRRFLSAFTSPRTRGVGQAVATSELFGTPGLVSVVQGAASSVSTASANLKTGAALAAAAVSTATVVGSLRKQFDAAAVVTSTATANLTALRPISAIAVANSTAGLASGINAILFSSPSVSTSWDGTQVPQLLANVASNINRDIAIGDVILVVLRVSPDVPSAVATLTSGGILGPVIPLGKFLSGGSRAPNQYVQLCYAVATNSYDSFNTPAATISIAWSRSAFTGTGTADCSIYNLRGVDLTQVIEADYSGSTLASTSLTAPSRPSQSTQNAIFTWYGTTSTGTAPTITGSPTPTSAVWNTLSAQGTTFLTAQDVQPAATNAPSWVWTRAVSQDWYWRTIIFKSAGAPKLFVAAAIAQATAALTPVGAPAQFAGIATASSTATADLKIGAGLAGNAAAVATALLAPFISISGSASAVSTATADLVGQTRFVGSIAAVATASLFSTPPALLQFRLDANETPATGGRWSQDTTNIAVSIKAGKIDDLILLWFTSNAFTLTPTESGWTQVLRIPFNGNAIGTPDRKLFCFWRKDTRGNGDVTGVPDVYNFTWDGAGNSSIYQLFVSNASSAWSCSRWRNAKMATPISPYDEPIEGSASLGVYSFAVDPTTHIWTETIPSYNAYDANDVVVFGWGDQDGTGPGSSTYTFPGGLTEISRDASVGGINESIDSIYTHYKFLSAAGATGAVSASVSPGHYNNNARTTASAAVILRYQGTGIELVVNPQGRAAASGSMFGLPFNMAGNLTATATASGHLLDAVQLVGAASATPVVAASLSTRTGFAAAAAAVSATTAVLSTRTQFAAASQGSCAASASLTTAINLAGLATAVASALMIMRLEANARAAAAATAALLTRIQLNVAAAGNATALATLGPVTAPPPVLWLRVSPAPDITARTDAPEPLLFADL